MLRLVRWAFWLGASLSLLYFAVTVPLGTKTLVEHLRAIAQTPEAQELCDGTREKADQVAERLQHRFQGEPHHEKEAPTSASRSARRAPERNGR